MQGARFDSHLTGVKKESFYWLTKTIAHNKGFRESENKFVMLKKFFFSFKLLLNTPQRYNTNVTWHCMITGRKNGFAQVC